MSSQPCHCPSSRRKLYAQNCAVQQALQHSSASLSLSPPTTYRQRLCVERTQIRRCYCSNTVSSQVGSHRDCPTAKLQCDSPTFFGGLKTEPFLCMRLLVSLYSSLLLINCTPASAFARSSRSYRPPARSFVLAMSSPASSSANGLPPPPASSSATDKSASAAADKAAPAAAADAAQKALRVVMKGGQEEQAAGSCCKLR
jgi:hypothetical protein